MVVVLSKLELEVSFDVVDEMVCNLIEEYALHISMDHELTFYELCFIQNMKFPSLTRLKTIQIGIHQSVIALS